MPLSPETGLGPDKNPEIVFPFPAGDRESKEEPMSEFRRDDTASWDAQEVRQAQGARREAASAHHSKSRPRRRRQNPLAVLVGYLIFVLLASAILAGVGWMLGSDFCAFNRGALRETSVEVTAEDSVSTVANKLQDAGLIKYKWFFKLYAGISHADKKIGIGTYELNTDMDYNALIQGMSNRNATINADTVTVTIPEGYSVRQIVSLLAKYGVNSEDALLSAAERGSFDYSFLDSGKSGIAKLEGYLFPDTYEFFVNEDPSHAICRLLDNFSQRMDDELMTQVEESGYSLEEILIIASLIEKETDGKDRTNIASVIYNRLNNVGETYHKLEIDAAVIYGLGYANGENYAGPLTQADLNKDTPYNLRMHEGLPPTPICNPGLASIRAALEPADTNYYFYALGKDGVHHFFKTYREHVNFVNSSQYGG